MISGFTHARGADDIRTGGDALSVTGNSAGGNATARPCSPCRNLQRRNRFALTPCAMPVATTQVPSTRHCQIGSALNSLAYWRLPLLNTRNAPGGNWPACSRHQAFRDASIAQVGGRKRDAASLSDQEGSDPALTWRGWIALLHVHRQRCRSPARSGVGSCYRCMVCR